MITKSSLDAVLSEIDRLREQGTVISDYLLHKAAADTYATKGIATCSRYTPPSGGALVKVGDRSALVGYIRCKAYQICPVCHSRWLREQRRKLHRILSLWPGRVTTFSLTIGHGWSDPLIDSLTALKATRAKFVASNKYRASWVEGALLRLEISLGAAGWHPHIHGVILSTKEPTAAQIQSIEDAWIKAARANGCIVDKTHGAKGRLVFDKASAFNEASYMWKRGPWSPFALLEVIADAKSSKSNIEHAKTLWRDYCRGINLASRMRYVTPAGIIRTGWAAYSPTTTTREQALIRIANYVERWEENNLPLDLAAKFLSQVTSDVESLRYDPEVQHRINELEELIAELIEQRSELGLPEECTITADIEQALNELTALLATKKNTKTRLPGLVNLTARGSGKLLPREKAALEKATTHAEARRVLDKVMKRLGPTEEMSELFSMNYENQQINSMYLPSMDPGETSST